MTGRRALMLAAALAALAAGCGTFDNVRRPLYPAPNGTDEQVCRVYGGVRGTWSTVTEYPWRDTPSYLDYVVIPLMAALDLGLSGAADTLTLPYTVGVEVWRTVNPTPPPELVPAKVDPVPVPAPGPVPGP